MDINMQLNTQQQESYDAFHGFTNDPDGVLFSLFGRAGTGKSFTSSQLYGAMNIKLFDEFLWLAPTWKAVRVCSRFLDEMSVKYEIGFDPYVHQQGRMVVTTTQQALGIRPLIAEDQDDKTEKFGQMSASGLIGKLRPKYVVIDEVSMLSWDHLKQIHNLAKVHGSKVLVIGDPGQLPPVKAKEIKWDRLPNRYELTEIMRQSGDSAIPVLAGMIRDNDSSWMDYTGQDIRRERNVAGAFLESVGVPAVEESERDVYIAYRNVVVDRLQEAACQKVYGHSAGEFAAEEVVIAQSALYTPRGGMIVANQDELQIVGIHGEGEWGLRVELKVHSGRHVHAEYLSGKDMADPNNSWKIQLEHLRKDAIRLQQEFKAGDRSINGLRVEAWKRFFAHQKQTVLQFQHPFAITSHKSQGSTYGRAFVAANDISQFDMRGLYVACTRPKTELII